MSDEDSLLNAVLMNSSDRLPKLVYADWCDENGKPKRAEWLRHLPDFKFAELPLGVGIEFRVNRQGYDYTAECYLKMTAWDNYFEQGLGDLFLLRSHAYGLIGLFVLLSYESTMEYQGRFFYSFEFRSLGEPFPNSE